MIVSLLVLALVALSQAAACGVGSLDEIPEGHVEDDAGTGDDGSSRICPPSGCPTGYECRDGRCLPSDACRDVLCREGERCEDGFCVVVTVDPCEGVVCTNPGDVCQRGVCVSGERDADGDGYPASEDCDDNDPSINPGAEEICDGVDNNCDGNIDEGFDADGDGWTICGGGDPSRADCDDRNPFVFPGAPEICNGIDDNCDGFVDNNPIDVGLSCGSDVGECRSGTTVCVAGSIVCQGGRGPEPESCDGRDNDCDGVVDNGLGARSCSGACGAGTETCVSGRWVCDAPSSGVCSPGAVEHLACNCGTQRRTCTSTCTWGGWSSCSGAACYGGASCCDGACRLDVNNCGGCGVACPYGSRGSCCPDPYGMLGCCPDTHPFCGYDGYCYAY